MNLLLNKKNIRLEVIFITKRIYTMPQYIGTVWRNIDRHNR